MGVCWVVCTALLTVLISLALHAEWLLLHGGLKPLYIQIMHNIENDDTLDANQNLNSSKCGGCFRGKQIEITIQEC